MSFPADEALALLRKAWSEGRFAHGYLITGSEGSGKRRLAGELVALILETGEDSDPFTHPDCHVVEPQMKSRRIGVEAIRELQRQLQMRSLRGGGKTGILFDAERLNEAASNAFLKTLEEPPPRTHLFLLSSVPDQLSDTILSRCIEVSLQSTASRCVSALEGELLEALRQFSLRHAPELPHVFLLVRQFQELLARAKQCIQEENESAFKREEPLYKQVGNRDALEEREDFYKALTESRYLGERSRLLAIVEQWWADVLRHQALGGADLSARLLDHPEFAPDTARLAARYTASELLAKAAALETLRENFGRSVQEQLAIEVAFLHTFGA